MIVYFSNTLREGYLCVTVLYRIPSSSTVNVHTRIVFQMAEPTLKGCVVLLSVLTNVYVFPL